MMTNTCVCGRTIQLLKTALTRDPTGLGFSRVCYCLEIAIDEGQNRRARNSGGFEWGLFGMADEGSDEGAHLR